MDRVRDDRSGTKPTATLGAVEQQVLDVAKMVEECRVVAGTPEDAVRLLTKAQEMMGITQVDCTFYFGGIPFELAQRSHRLFAEKVMPKMRSVG